MPPAFGNLDGLLGLSRNEGVDIRPALVRVLTDLYVQEPSHTREEEQQYVELALRLLPAVDPHTRTAVRTKLTAYSATPKQLAEYLLGSTQADASTEPLINPASETEHPTQTSASIVTAHQFAVEPLRNSANIDLKAVQIGELFLNSDSPERRKLLLQLEERAAGNALNQTLLEFRPGTIEFLERTALQGNQRDFAQELQSTLGLSNRIAWRIVQDEYGEPLLIAARILAVPPDVLLRIMLFLNPRIGESVERVFALVPLYERLTLEMAAGILVSWQGASRLRAAARFQPVHAPDAPAQLGVERENARMSTDVFVDRAARRTSANIHPQRSQDTA